MAGNKSVRYTRLQEILKQKVLLFQEISEFPTIVVKGHVGSLASYSIADKQIICDAQLLREPYEVQEEVIMHELCHYVLRALYGSALISLINEMCAVKLMQEKDPKSFKTWMRIGHLLDLTDRQYYSYYYGYDPEEMECALYWAMGIREKECSPQYLFKTISLEFYFSDDSDAKEFAERYNITNIKREDKMFGVTFGKVSFLQKYEDVYNVLILKKIPESINEWIMLGKKEYKEAIKFKSFLTVCIGLGKINFCVPIDDHKDPFLTFLYY
jgi:hypothetical protein